MASFAISFNSTTARTLDGSESGAITNNGSLLVSGDDAVHATFGTNWLTNNGTIWAYGGGFAAVEVDGSVFEMLNGRDGLISAENPTQGTLDIDVSTHADVVNHGVIYSSNDDAINFNASDTGAVFFLENTGEISANSGEALDIDVGNQYTYMTNNGNITARQDAIDLVVDISASTYSTLVNNGTITSEEGRALDISVGTNGSFRMINNGTISAVNQAFYTTRGGDVYITNTGTMASSLVGSSAILLGAGLDVIRNSGEIFGAIQMGDSNDLYQGIGDGHVSTFVYGDAGTDTLIGGSGADSLDGGEHNDSLVGRDGEDHLIGGLGEDTMRGGSGDDEIYGDSNADEIHGGSGDDMIDGGSGTDSIFGNGGDDTILGGTADDTISGGSGNDDIRGGSNTDDISGGSGNDILRGESGSDNIGGGAGEDTLSGSSGNDSMDGGSGDDRLFGGANNDTLEGTLGDDYLDGGSGDDSMRGGSDNDTLDGGSGQDTLSGGSGADVFVFNAETDSPHGADRDVITDFEAGIDTIDLSGFAGTLNFVSSYSGTAGEVRYNDSIGRVYIDLDGDSSSDVSFDVTGAPALTEDDFIL
ncbi:calcium-binding protein [uncultured Pelagimonas sp.]|uniref:calcium-binding protein n=1 Tax=uncultured Pelagimonas sp. TaxID=1618102 RepID=UPI0026232E7E|nr:calcium-binding protein [uncultured Pelagimonas sp.]